MSVTKPYQVLKEGNYFALKYLALFILYEQTVKSVHIFGTIVVFMKLEY